MAELSGANLSDQLSGPSLEPKSGNAKRLVVFLHGYGADGNDLIDIGRAWQPLLPDTAFVSPHAPEPCGQSAGRPAMVRPHVPRSGRALAGREQGRAGAERFPRSRSWRAGNCRQRALALVGFSQGTMMSLHAGLRRAVPPAAIVGYSGMFIMPNDGPAGNGCRTRSCRARRCC